MTTDELTEVLQAEVWLNDLEQECVEVLDQLADLQDRLEVLRMDHQEQVEALIPQELKDETARLHKLFAAQTEGVNTEILDLHTIINTNTLALQHTVKGERRQAVWNRGREGWDMRALNAYAKAHPEILTLKKRGVPYVSTRKVRGR